MLSAIKSTLSHWAKVYLAIRHRLSIITGSLLLLLATIILCLPFINTYQGKVDQDLSQEFAQLDPYFTGQTSPLLSANSFSAGYFEETDQSGQDQVADLHLYYFPSAEDLGAIEASDQAYFVFLPDQYFYRLKDGQGGQGAYPSHWRVPRSMDKLLDDLEIYQEKEQAQSRFMTLLAFRHIFFVFIVFAYAFLTATYLNRRRRLYFPQLMNFEDCFTLVTLAALPASLLTLLVALFTQHPSLLAVSFIIITSGLLFGQIKLISKK
ncbi:hypothetical protein [Aerococcus sp. UMB7834]|uniref:hypothetical protein n=1 Tax=Aerococcus sp. UMB7834 TaxID=3046342 RepID=UPI0025509D6B|nr:hypothetical protein [Aerococcus sp. UMB7834]MDK6805960.1 hypothetical protein [Aerococcus sp. UMB7834]